MLFSLTSRAEYFKKDCIKEIVNSIREKIKH